MKHPDGICRDYVTTTGTVPVEEIGVELGLTSLTGKLDDAFGKVVSEFDTLHYNHKRLSRKVANLNTEGGGGQVVIKINDKEVKRTEGTHYHPKFEQICNYAKWHKNVFLMGEAGTGKTTVAKQVADALDVDYGHLHHHCQC